MKKSVMSLIIFITFLLVSCTNSDENFIKEDVNTEVRGMVKSTQPMTFQVTIPKNTPDGDTVWIYIHQKPHKMNKVADYTYEVKITADDTEIDGDGGLSYRYSRNMHQFNTAEFLEPDTNDYFWTKHGRKEYFTPGKIVEDNIERWRWFPKEGTPIIRTTTLTPTENFQQRIQNKEFASGQVIEDLYTDSFYDFFDPTAKHMKEVGYKWAVLAPPEQWVIENNLPKIRNMIDHAPNYPDGRTFKDHIKAFKKQGLKVMVGPQVCCTEINFQSQSKEWWESYFKEMEKFLVRFAKLSEEAGADSFFYSIGTEELNSGFDLDKKWTKIWSAIGTEFSGEIGQMVWNAGENTIPETNFVKWDDQLDFYYVLIDASISESLHPTEVELKAGAGKAIDSMKPFFTKFNKPIFVQTMYFNVKDTWRGGDFYSISDVTYEGDSEQNLVDSKYSFDTHDQARVINAFFHAIAERPWVVGYFQFGYQHWEQPLSPWMSIRGKPSEDLWKKWNTLIYSQPVTEVLAPRIVNGKTVEIRIEEAYEKLHDVDSANYVRENFPDIEVVFTDNGEESWYPAEILPFKYMYSEEADKTFSLCEIDRTVFICDGKLNHLITDEEMNSERCKVTPIYTKK